MQIFLPDVEVPEWVRSGVVAIVGALSGYLTGRRGRSARASKDEADAASKVTDSALKVVRQLESMTASALARAESVEIDNRALRQDVDTLMLLAAHVAEQDESCGDCNRRVPLPLQLSEKIRNSSSPKKH